MAYTPRDAFYRRAKSEGYRSRAAYKLLDLARRYHLIHRGDRVIDLGAWPGGWTQVAAELTGPRGLVVAVDLRPLDQPDIAGAVSLVGDIREPAVLQELMRSLGGQADVLLSDMAPKLSGVRDRDRVAADELARATLVVADLLLKPGGCLLMKLFMSGETEALLREMRGRFASVKLSRPEASRRGSAETYLIARK
jgi:23S rRNA (uridine2552-2'-O)-methyltransferase